MSRGGAISEVERPSSVLAFLRAHPRFAGYAAAQGLSYLGARMQAVAVAWTGYELTGRPETAALLLAVQAAPYLLFGLFGGALVERLGGWRLYRGTQMALLALATTLTVASVTSTLTLALLYAVSVLEGLISVVDVPARMSLTIDIVGRVGLRHAIGINAFTANLGAVAGAAVGGVAISALGAESAFLTNAVTFAVVLACLPLARAEGAPIGASAPAPLSTSSVALPLPALLAATAAVSVAFTSVATLLPALVVRQHGADLAVYGWLAAALAAGGLLGSLWSTRLTSNPRLLAAAAACIAAACAVTVPTRADAAAPLLLLLGACYSVSNVAGNRLIQLNAAPDRRVRNLGAHAYLLLGVPFQVGLAAAALSERSDPGAAVLAVGVLAGLLLVVPAWRLARHCVPRRD